VLQEKLLKQRLNQTEKRKDSELEPILILGMFVSSFAGSLLAILGYTSYQKRKQLKVAINLYKELKQTIDTEISFAQLAEQLRKEGFGND